MAKITNDEIQQDEKLHGRYASHQGNSASDIILNCADRLKMLNVFTDNFFVRILHTALSMAIVTFTTFVTVYKIGTVEMCMTDL